MTCPKTIYWREFGVMNHYRVHNESRVKLFKRTLLERGAVIMRPVYCSGVVMRYEPE